MVPLNKLAFGHTMYEYHLLARVVSVNSFNSKTSLGRGKKGKLHCVAEDGLIPLICAFFNRIWFYKKWGKMP